MINMSDYIDRKFRRMKPSEQRFINAARDDNVYWRGEDIETFKRVYEETQRMRSMGAKKYRAEAITRLKDMIRRIGREAKNAR